MKITVSDARVKDVEGLQEVFYRTWLATYPNKEHGITVDDIEERFKDRHSGERLNDRRAAIATLDENNKYLVAKDDDTVVGLCRLTKHEMENRVTALYVLPEYQGKGVGTALWSEALNFFDRSKDIVVNVATYNQKAINFYTKLGFKDMGRRSTDERRRMKSGSILPEMEMRIIAL